MPMGEDGRGERLDQYWPLKDLRARLADADPHRSAERTGGPARYVRVEETGQKIGFITPLTHNFCESCNRVRLTCTGELYMCLGQEDMADLRAPLRASPDDTASQWNRRSAPPSRASPRAMISTIPARPSRAR
jgi:cyclic pyranopterin phosphate synthase